MFVVKLHLPHLHFFERCSVPQWTAGGVAPLVFNGLPQLIQYVNDQDSFFDWHSKMDPSARHSMEAACSFVCVTTAWMRRRKTKIYVTVQSHHNLVPLVLPTSVQLLTVLVFSSHLYLSFLLFYVGALCARVLLAASGISFCNISQSHGFYRYGLLGVPVTISPCSLEA